MIACALLGNLAEPAALVHACDPAALADGAGLLEKAELVRAATAALELRAAGQCVRAAGSAAR